MHKRKHNHDLTNNAALSAAPWYSEK